MPHDLLALVYFTLASLLALAILFGELDWDIDGRRGSLKGPLAPPGPSS
ncbi:hypothetical protein HOU03_gp182 [Caulobacter phage CcrSC]|uniref:Uncharacterized protein n=1 Tax=Caulobacter phage CcrSC TaxID=2283272 RepID=A0A385ED27_9CAUD|nr:hypothetical protein HOU03_gp004 [Caulobacter phage CcrSC]YP_009810716.1 hypothetical protein HOU03_gp182 [Caulobacter phage CcrSC]AXQ69586.1 hypothetical protein CcrSC_gp004 [Caulobacter phage CcrSC]AXQ70086.1 hypothetical protein CcrSC_gp504 [Caulobacter phage CcrSC]